MSPMESRFRAGDQIQAENSEELILVTGVSGNTITVVRGYAGTTAENIANGQVIKILGNAALEGDDKPAARFTNRVRCGNYTQIFTAGVEVSGTNIAAGHLGISDEMDYQKAERLRELVRDLENTVINGGKPSANPQGGARLNVAAGERGSRAPRESIIPVFHSTRTSPSLNIPYRTSRRNQ